MNQILQTEIKKNKESIEITKIVKFFAITIGVFSVILIGLGSYYLIKNNKEENDKKAQLAAVPNVDITQEEESISVKVQGTVAISKIEYNWNGEQTSTIEGNNSTSLEEIIELPIGTNILNLTVIDVNGKETKYQREYTLDSKKPVIELTLTKDYKIKISVKDTTGLKYINYSWNEGEKTKVNVTKENPNLIEEIVEIPLGQNTLKVEAINKDEITSSKELEVKGIKRPTLSFRKDGDYLIIRAEDEGIIKIVEYTLNGQKYQLNFKNKGPVLEYRQELQKGENHMEITAENMDGGKITNNVLIKN